MIYKRLGATLLAAILLAGCGTKNLSHSCLPIKAPVEVILARETPMDRGIYTYYELEPTYGRPADWRLPAGTPLSIKKITQEWAIDTSGQSIEVFGTLPDGKDFKYAWGRGKTLQIAPWESPSTPATRTVDCSNS